MSVRAIAPRRLLPGHVRRALVLDGLPEWEDGLARVGVELGAADPELVVSPAAEAERALALEGPMLIVVGAARGERWLALPEPQAPELLVPLGSPAAARYALRHWRPGASRVHAVRNRIAEQFVVRGIAPRRGSVVTVSASGVPELLRPALEHGVPAGSTWFLSCGRGDFEVVRDVFHVLAPGERQPSWVLKMARIPGYTDPFDWDERGLAVAHAAGPVVSEHAPRQVARYRVEGVEAALQTAAVGTRLDALLAGRGGRESKLGVLDRLAAWLVEVARATARPAGERPQLAELARRWSGFALGLDRLDGVPATLAHNDLYAEHLIVDGDAFMAIDWETALAEGLPLWDLLFLLADGYARLDRAGTTAAREEHFVRLFRGELPLSEPLFARVRELAGTLELPRPSVGALATLLWAHHGLEPGATEPVDPHGPEEDLPPKARLALRWLREPGLGVDWDAWSR